MVITGFVELYRLLKQYVINGWILEQFLPVEAYNFGMQVLTDKIKSSFNRPRGGTVERIRDGIIIEYSKQFLINYHSKYYRLFLKRGNL